MRTDDSVFVKFKGNRPHQGTSGAAGHDLLASVAEPVTIKPGEWKLIPTGTYLELPTNCAGLVMPRSGLALKCGVTVLNSPGLIDSDYRGEVGVILYNSNPADDFIVTDGMRVAQLVVIRVPELVLVAGQNLSDTVRGADGFGSTGTE